MTVTVRPVVHSQEVPTRFTTCAYVRCAAEGNMGTEYEIPTRECPPGWLRVIDLSEVSMRFLPPDAAAILYFCSWEHVALHAREKADYAPNARSAVSA